VVFFLTSFRLNTCCFSYLPNARARLHKSHPARFNQHNHIWRRGEIMKLHSLLWRAPSTCYFVCRRNICSSLTHRCQIELPVVRTYFRTYTHNTLIPLMPNRSVHPYRSVHVLRSNLCRNSGRSV
jgi:hypothetical protein